MSTDRLEHGVVISDTREHLGEALLFENGAFCVNPDCWCAELNSGQLLVVNPDGSLAAPEESEE